MLESDFLISLNNMVVTDNYDSNYFNSVFEMLKKYCEADAVITDDFRKNENMISYKNIALSNNDIIINIEVISKRLVIKNVKKDFVNKDFFIKMLHVILNNIFKNYLMIEKLKKDKYIDSLLQVYNRTAYNELIQEKKKYSNCAVAFIDANGLSIVNNRYGHEEGDRFLIAVCDAFKTFFRYSDIYRIGGDEFIIICEDIDEALFSEKMKKAMEKVSLTLYTVSVGTIYCESVDDLQSVVRDAGIIMKKNKEEYRKNNPDKYINKYDVTYVGRRLIH